MIAAMARMSFVLIFLCFIALINLAFAQDQTGFLSIDCGLQPEISSYTEPSTGIKYVSDSSYTERGINGFLAPENRQNLMQSMWSVRSFPEGTRNCYTLAVNSSSKYLVRATFMYGNYDSRNEMPEFDLHLGPNKWDTVKLVSLLQIESKEIIHYVLTETLQVCLVNTGRGTPFISELELRPLPNSSYEAQSGSLQLFQRLDFGSSTNQTVRYPDDVFDRIWFPFIPEGSQQFSDLSATLPRDATGNYRPPAVIMRTAIIPASESGSLENPPLDFSWTPDNPSLEFYVFMYFAELQEPNSVSRREFMILLNSEGYYGPLSLDYLRTIILFSRTPLRGQKFEFSFRQTRNSILPPLINAIEIYFANKLTQSSMDQSDFSAMRSIKSAYKVEKNWQGDACVPQAFTWDGVTCSSNGTAMARVISLNLSNSGLTGEIVSDLTRLSQLQTLDLSNNNLSGPVPAFLAELQFLKLLILDNNQLSGPVPSTLTERNGLSFSISGNPSICSTSGCVVTQTDSEVKKKTKLPSFLIPLIAAVAGLFLLIIISGALLLIFMRKKKQGQTIQRTITASSGPSLRRRDTGSARPTSLQRRETAISSQPSLQRIESGMTDYGVNETAIDGFDLEPANKKFTYAEIVNITNGFDKDQGKVGFGRNYLGNLDGKEVTVKLVSSSLSSQGYKQLRAEVKHLFRIHHKNLITMLGYCNEGDKMAVIYEYMANGNLKQHMSESSTTVFSWEDRLGIAVDVAQGLEYLHNACTPPIIHRNVKCTNVFLDEKFNAKLGGFGLSRAFDAAEGSHLNTVIAGTPGYVDPEYYTSNMLTEKSDVYSFGVVLLEIITAKPAIIKTEQRMHVCQWVESLFSRESIVEILDPNLCGDYDVNSAFKTVEIAMACVRQTSGERPKMSQVVIALKESLSVEIERKTHLPVLSTDSVEDLALGFGSNPPPRLR